MSLSLGEATQRPEVDPLRVSTEAGTKEPSRRRERVDSLDGLRAIAVLMVFVYHTDEGLFPGGYLGVHVFFALSGYLITRLLLGEHHRSGAVALSAFYARRALRLWPALIAVTVVATALAISENIGHEITDAIFSLLYLTNVWQAYSLHYSLLGHTWSLGVEEQFYLAWPATLMVALRMGISPKRVMFVAMSIGLLLTVLLSDNRAWSQFLPWTPLAAIGLGVLAALGLAEPGKTMHRMATTPAATACLAVLALAGFLVPLTFWPAPVLVAPVASLLVVHLVSRLHSPIARALASPRLVWLGARSYGFYLWHFPIVAVLARHTNSRLTVMVLGLALTLVATAISWEAVEQPFLKSKSRFERPTLAVAVTA